MTKQMLWVPLLLASAAVHIAQADINVACVGKGVEAASFIASAGLQAAILPQECSYAKATGDCMEAVEKIITALGYAAQVTSECVGSNACAKSGTKVFHSLMVLVDMADSLRPGADWSSKRPGVMYRPPALAVDLFANQLAATSADFASAIGTCTGDDSTATGLTQTELGNCVGKSLGTGVIVSAAGMAAKEAADACKGGVSDHCHLGRLFVFNTLSLGANEAIQAASSCKANGKLDCASDISMISAKITEAASWGTTMKVDAAHGYHNLAPRMDMEAMGSAIAAVGEEIQSSAASCNDDATVPKVDVAKCVGNVVSGIAYLASASLGISLAVKDCAGETVRSELLHCLADLGFVIKSYAKSTNEILWATSNCAREEMLDTVCASDITMSMKAIAGALIAASGLTKLAVHDDAVTELATVRDPVTGKTSVETMGGALSALSSQLSIVVGSCSAKRRLHATAAQITDAELIAQKWNWGAKAKEWLNAHEQKKTHAEAFSMGTVAAVAAAAAGLVLLSIVTVAARLTYRRANARATLQTVQAQEDAELLEQIVE